MKRLEGFSYIELIVVMAMLGVLSSITIPYASMAIQRSKERQLKDNLMMIRKAIDRFHEDWEEDKFSKFDSQISSNGYPVDLTTLVTGVDGKDEGFYRYMRKVPTNPLDENSAEPWLFIGYKDIDSSGIWNGEDVYDVISGIEGVALNGTNYESW
jgi:general secretion pathway protein G